MKTVLSLFILLFTLNAVASDSTQVTCEMKREGWDRMSFEFRFLTPKRAVAFLHSQKDEMAKTRSIPVTAVHQSLEARYVGINFLGEEKLVFILVGPVFAPENLGIPLEIEVVSSIYGPANIKCQATK